MGRWIAVRSSAIRLVVHRPPGATDLPVVVYLHGGGWVIGSEHHNRWLCSHIASRVGAVVVSIGYRLAPEHPFPAAVDDAWDALIWVARHAPELGGDPARLGVMGDSAGANLATVVSRLARDRGGPAVAHQTLIYPPTDLRPEHAPGPEFDLAPMLPKARPVGIPRAVPRRLGGSCRPHASRRSAPARWPACRPR